MRPRQMLCGKLAELFSLLVFAASVGLIPAQAQTWPRETDQRLNTSYRAAMAQLPAATREKLRNAQRAWLEFVVKNGAAMRLAAGALYVSTARCEEIEVVEVEKRTVDFSYSKESNTPAETEGNYQRVDADLNSVYQRCLTTLSSEAKAALREAQRAWVTYRDANRPFGAQFVTGLTARRSDQLSDFYIKATTAPVTTKAPVKAERPPPDPFERAR